MARQRIATVAGRDPEGRGRNVVKTMAKIPFSFRSATTADVPKLAALVRAAYGHYVERIGMLPRPMTDDYVEVIENRRVTLAESHGSVVGVIVLSVDEEGFLSTMLPSIPPIAGKASGRPSSSSREPKPGARASNPFICTRTKRWRRTWQSTRKSGTSSTIGALEVGFP